MVLCKTVRNRAQDQVYMGVKGTSLEDAKARNEKLTEELKAVIEA